uniref:hypothetical protein n=1 Tax=uncultured Parolsenella sp. TaxID=2083008 RepID=UPI0027DBBA8D
MRGIDKFKERFAGHDGEYVLIGGGACDLLFGEAGQDFRATKDLDLVVACHDVVYADDARHGRQA